MKSEGECAYCKKTVASVAMSRHLLSHPNTEGKKDIFLIRASAGPFFVYFEVGTGNTLSKVDDFLRDLWLDCCGHLSAFTIGNMRYNSYDEDLGFDDRTMDAKLSSILKPGMKFMHEYDFGTTTDLELKVISPGKGEGGKIKILARNNLPDFRCKCGKEAVEICGCCDENLLCTSCAKKHECGEEMLLPVVNSPRMGQCGYTGD